MQDPLSPETVLTAVLNLDPEALLAGTGTDHLSRLFEHGAPFLEGEPPDEERRPRPRRKRPTQKRRAEVAEAVRVLRALARQADEGVRNGALRVTPEEKRVLDRLLARPVTWEAAVQFPEPVIPDVGDTDSRHPLVGSAPLPIDDEDHLRVSLKPTPRGRVRSLFEFFLSFAAVTLAEIIGSGQGKRIGVCQAPAKRSRLYSRKKCGRFWVRALGRPRESTCSDACYQRAEYRKESLKKARRAARKRRERERRLTGKGRRIPRQ